MTEKVGGEKLLYCSFCGKSQHEVRKLIAGLRPVLRNIGGVLIICATIAAPTVGELADEVALAMHTRAFTGRLAQSVHAYPTWSSALQQTAAQFFFTYGGRDARPPRHG